MKSIPLGVYVDSNSLVHRLPAGWKFLILVVFVICTSILRENLRLSVFFFALVFAAYGMARIPINIAWQQWWPILPVLSALGLFQWWQRDAIFALGMVLAIFSAVMAATLLTLTTKVSEMMDAFDRGLRPFARFGIPVETITLAMSLTIRMIPLQLSAVNEILAARKARGLGFSIVAFGTPLIIRCIKRAHSMSEALIARGVGEKSD